MAQYEVTLRDYWRILRRRKGVVLFTAALLGVLSFLVASVWQPRPRYRAVAKVQIAAAQGMANLYLQNLSYNSSDQIETQRAIITSYPVLKRTGEELGMFKRAGAAEDTARAVLGLQEQVTTRQEGYTNIVAIEATDPEPARARDLANTVSRVYQEYNHDLKNQQAVKHRQFVEGQRETARVALELAEEAVKQYRESNELVSLESQASVILQQITASEQGVQRLEDDLGAVAAMQQEIDSQRGLSEESIRGASQAQVGQNFIRLSEQLGNLRLEREGLLVQYTEDHPRVLEVRAKIDQLKRNLGEELRQRRVALLREAGNARALLGKARGDYGQLPSRGLELARLQREVTMRQEVATALEEQYQTALIREADQLDEVTPLQWAITPTAPVNPHHPLQRAALGVLLGLVLGLVFAVVAETLDTSIGTIEDVQEYAGAQVVGVIPFIDVDEVGASLRRRGRKVDDQRTLQRQAQLVAYFDPQSTLAESYRTLRTNIEFATVEKGARCLMVTSSMLREGKSTTIANLAMTMAQMGKRTLLVDCDLRKPALARLFGLEKEPGVTEVIVGNYQWREVLRTVTDIVTGGMGMEDVLQTQGISNLHIITSGAIPPNPAELLNSRRMADFIAEVQQAYDVVLIDAPPVLQVTDAAILGKRVDGVLMVYKAGDIPRTSLKRSTSLLRSMQVELLGVVINGIRADLTSDYQDLGYHSYYAYGAEAEAEPSGVGQRLREYARRFRQPRDDEEEVADELEEEVVMGPARPIRKGTTVTSYALLVLAGLGLVWQSGYLNRAVGLAPLLAGYQGTDETGTRTGPPASSRAAGEPAVAPPARSTMGDAEERPLEPGSTAGSSGPGRETASQAPEPLPELGAGSPDARAQLSPQAGAPAPGSFAQPPGTAAPPTRGPVAPVPATQAEPFRSAALPPEREPASSHVAPSPDPTQPSTAQPTPDAAPTAPASVGHRPYALRVAAYAPASSWAGRALRRLRQGTDSAFLVPAVVAGRRLERLLVGSFASSEEADVHGRVLRQQGLVEEYAVMRLAYAVELGSYPSRARAGEALARLPDAGRTAYLQEGPDGSVRLLAGAFASEEEARAYTSAAPAVAGQGRVAAR